MDEVGYIINFAKAVRKSTIDRLILVPEGLENWKVSKDKMNFAEITRHLIDTDKWLIEKLKNPNLTSIKGNAGSLEVNSRSEYYELTEELKSALNDKLKFIRSLSFDNLEKKIFDDRFGKEVSIWWIIMRGNIDHEIHHRGQISAYLQIINLEI